MVLSSSSLFVAKDIIVIVTHVTTVVFRAE
jgi:hypothetical protein